MPKMRAAACPAQTGTASFTPCKRLPNSPSWIPCMRLHLKDIRQSKRMKATDLKPLLWVGHPSATGIGNAVSPSFRCLNFTSPQQVLLSQSCLMVTQQLVNQMRMIKHKPPPYLTLFHGGSHIRRDSHLQECLVNTPHLCSHHVQAPKLTHTWLLSLHDQHRLSARATLLLLPAHPLSC